MVMPKRELMKLPISRARLNEVMVGRGMIPLDQVHKPMAFALHTGVHTLDDFRQWAQMKRREYGRMAAEEARYDDDPELKAWVTGKAAAFEALGAAIDRDVPLDRMRYWVNRISGAVSRTRIRLQMEDFHMGSERGQRIFALDGAWSNIREELDYVLDPDPEKSVMPQREEALAGPEM